MGSSKSGRSNQRHGWLLFHPTRWIRAWTRATNGIARALHVMQIRRCIQRASVKFCNFFVSSSAEGYLEIRLLISIMYCDRLLAQGCHPRPLFLRGLDVYFKFSIHYSQLITNKLGSLFPNLSPIAFERCVSFIFVFLVTFDRQARWYISNTTPKRAVHQLHGGGGGGLYTQKENQNVFNISIKFNFQYFHFFFWYFYPC